VGAIHNSVAKKSWDSLLWLFVILISGFFVEKRHFVVNAQKNVVEKI